MQVNKVLSKDELRIHAEVEQRKELMNSRMDSIRKTNALI